MSDSYRLRTPEQIDLAYDVAGLGSRTVAIILDLLIQGSLLVALAIALIFSGDLVSRGLNLLLGADSDLPSVITFAVLVLATFLIIWGYYIFFETLWNGQTPGKRAAGIRVLTTSGQPIGLVHAFVRNLLRIIDFLPTAYMIGALVMLLNARSQRLGDLAAGTIVVKERRAAAPQAMETPAELTELPGQLAVLLSAQDVALARDFLQRRAELSMERRRELAESLARRFRDRLGLNGSDDGADSLIERVAALRR